MSVCSFGLLSSWRHLKGREEECGTSHPSAKSLFRTSICVRHHAHAAPMKMPCKHSLCHGILLPRHEAPLFMSPQSLHEGMLENLSWASIAGLFHDQLAAWFSPSPFPNMPQQRTWNLNHGQGGLLSVNESEAGRWGGTCPFQRWPTSAFRWFSTNHPWSCLTCKTIIWRLFLSWHGPKHPSSLWSLHQDLLCGLKATTDGLQQTLTQDYRCNSGHQAKHLWSDVGGDGNAEHPRQCK